MAEYSAVIKEAKRMCWHYTQGGNHDKCPMYPACNVSQCRKIAFERPADFEERIMAWAAEHPEPVYPTWIEYFLTIGLAERAGYGYRLRVEEFNKPIESDIAKKLGIEPKEG